MVRPDELEPGDAANMTWAVLESYFERHSTRRPLVIVTVNRLLRATPVMDGCLTEVVTLALRSVSRVHETSEDAVVDALHGTIQEELLTEVSELLLHITHWRASHGDRCTY
ncbi:hypothetical protein NXY56_006364 [Leishmania guyanensis]|uniref:Uncharacterized protein n=1 Tax=Leishmania guyanensis TaxID=5670 RepID=A0A1E1J5B7_LEIGU|nr:hypothetical protein, conserved [Leishmania guyanensis]